MAKLQQRDTSQDYSSHYNTSEWRDNKEEVTFVWLTCTQLDIKGGDGEFTLQRLREINNFVVTFNESTACIDYVNSIKDERVFLIVDGALVDNVFESVRTCRVIDEIYIFCRHRDRYEHWLNCPKIAGVFTQQSNLIDALRSGVRAVERQVLAFSQLDQPQCVLTKDLSQESASFLWFMLLVQVLKAMPTVTKEEREAMLDICTAYYKGNARFLADIDEFRRTYTPDKALSWYTRASFVYKLVNKALRVEDVELLYHFRFFVIDLCAQLEQEWLSAKSFGLTELRSIVFRGGKLTRTELESLKPGHLITTNGFLSTTREETVAGMFTRGSDSIYSAVLFHITIPENLTTLVFADVDRQHTSFSHENEVLFSIGSRFRVDQVYVDKNDVHLNHVHLIATDDGREDVDAYRDWIQKDLHETKPIFLFGRMILDMSKVAKAENYFQLLLQTTPADQVLDVATIHGYLGRIERQCDRLDEALSHHKMALKIRKQHLPPCHADLAASFNTLGLDYYYVHDYKNALDHFQRALDIEMGLYGKDGHTNIAKVLGHMALVCQTRSQYALALDYFKRALSIEQRLLPPQHTYIAFRLENLATLYMCRGEHELALIYYRQGLSIIERTLPVYHPKYSHILCGMINALEALGGYRQAIEFCMRKLTNDQTAYGLYHRYVGWSMTCLGSLYLKVNDLSKARQYLQEALNIQEKCNLLNSPAVDDVKKCLDELEKSDSVSSSIDGKIFR